MHIRIQYRSHLCLLYRADLALGVHDKDADILLPPQSVDGRATSVTTRSTNDRQMLPTLVILRLVLIAPDEEVLKQVSQKLQRNILESKRRAMEQLQ